MDPRIKVSTATVCAALRGPLGACASPISPRTGFPTGRNQQLDGGSCEGIV